MSDCRLNVSGEEYERYETDVPAVYTENVYERNDEGLIVIITDPDTGDRYPSVLHYIDDPVLDDDGNPVLRHKKGDVKLIDGEPVIIVDRGRLFFLDILLLNSIYYFASVREQVDLYRNIPKLILDFFKNDLAVISGRLLERTELYYVPKKTIGRTVIQVSKDNVLEIASEQTITVDFYVSPSTNKDSRLKESFEEATLDEIVKWLNSIQISISTLIGRLTDILGDEIKGIRIHWNNELRDITSFTIIDHSESVNIKQELIVNYDNTLEIRKSISFNYFEQGN